LHDGAATTLQEVFSRFNPNTVHGATKDLSKEELDDLVEYLKIL
jgi:oligoribonuclease (3'-5' exoribonuclease)